MANETTARTDSEQPMISLRDLRVSYGDTEILHGVSFDVKRGETMVILGGSGSGKSTSASNARWISNGRRRAKFGSRAKTSRQSLTRSWTKSASESECRFKAARCWAR